MGKISKCYSQIHVYTHCPLQAIIMSVLFRCACRHLALVSMSILQGYYSLVTFAENESFFFFW